jgi:long-chain acyl-CoA synthetase
MPLFHIGGSGWALCGMSRGGRSIILRDVEPVEILRVFETERITETFLVPAVLMFLLVTPALETTDLSSSATSSTAHRRSARRASSSCTTASKT